MEINDGLRARIKEDAMRSYPDGAHSHYVVCEVCGSFQWMMTKTDAPFGLTFLPMGMERNFNCPKCADAVARAPELCQWVLDVVGMHIPTKEEE